MAAVVAEHSCTADDGAPFDAYGPAVDGCDADANGVLWVANDEYATAVLFCPYCGFRGADVPDTRKYQYGYKFAKDPLPERID